MKLHVQTLFLVVAATLMVFNPDVFAVIKVELPVSKRYDIANSVLVGKVTKVNPDNRVVDVSVTQTLKGDAGLTTFRLQIVNPPELIKSIAIDQPVVIFTKRQASVHIADTWLVAAPVPELKPPVFRATQVDRPSEPSFPGTTASLVRVLEDMKAGKSTLLDAFNGKIFTGGVEEIAKLNIAKPTFLLSVDVNGDKKPDLIVGTAAGVKLFLATANGFVDATDVWGLAGVNASCAAAGNVNGDGKLDLLLDKTLFLNDGQKFSPAPKAIEIDGAAAVLASSLGDFTGGGKLDAAFVMNDGRLVVFKNNGQTATPWTKDVDRKLIAAGPSPQTAVFGDFSGDGKPAVILVQENAITRFVVKGDDSSAGFSRLTGDALDRIKGFNGGLKNVAATRIDINGDHRPDLLITSESASLMLLNRGYGVFLADPDAAAELNAIGGKGLPFPLNAARARVAVNNSGGGPDDLLVMSDEGRLFLIKNPSKNAR